MFQFILAQILHENIFESLTKLKLKKNAASGLLMLLTTTNERLFV